MRRFGVFFTDYVAGGKRERDTKPASGVLANISNGNRDTAQIEEQRIKHGKATGFIQLGMLINQYSCYAYLTSYCGMRDFPPIRLRILAAYGPNGAPARPRTAN